MGVPLRQKSETVKKIIKKSEVEEETTRQDKGDWRSDQTWFYKSKR